ncbi:Penicillin-binding protein PbpB [Polystyrenella longa]|uniref:Penicillin-binding protein PbpB n=2 Tax=Polystyrenella longa TaxID=2528007 RepID=A0A518CUH8_9PLAN|nr:Penicillin-binding protein PbpB [Polystyrenella longa]
MEVLRTDQNPLLRLLTLLVGFGCIVSVILYRLYFIQTELTDDYAALFDKEYVAEVSLPSLDGRILTREGMVLAEDRQVLNLTSHYRWLEEPANENWLKRHARNRLSPQERRDKEKIAEQELIILAERDAMWERVAQLTGQTTEEIRVARKAIQLRVERQLDAVNRRQAERETQAAADNEDETDQPDDWWSRLSHSVKRELTTTPHRHADDPLVIREELEYHTVVENITMETASRIKTHRSQFPGLDFDTTNERHYPQRDLAAHIIGVRRPLTPEQYAERQETLEGADPLDYQIGDHIGLTGLEKRYDRQIRGLRGLRRIRKNQHGEILSDEVVRNPRKGRNVIVSLNSQLQRTIQDFLENEIALGDEIPAINEEDQRSAEEVVDGGPVQTAIGQGSHIQPPAGGAVIVLDVRTGEVVAAVSAPGFDLELMSHPEKNLPRWQQLQQDQRGPFMTRFTQMAVAPGSVFKTMSSIAMLHSGQWNPDEPRFCQGFLHRPHQYRCYIYSHYGHGHGDMSLTDALCQSCNVYFFTAAEELGAQPFVDWARRLGFGQRSGIDLPDERSGNLPNLKPGDVGYSGNSRGLAIGQARLTTTPIQIARMMAFIANGGELVTPYIVDQIEDVDAVQPQFREPTVLPIPGANDDMLARIREGLWMVVQNPRGTGYKHVRLSEVEIAGKTGTAEVGAGRRDHAWFAGYVPADRPKYAFAVVMEHAGSGGKMAGPVAKKVVQTMLEVGLLGAPAELASKQTKE